jgi:catechol 2,3-dioxygenase-like lactoylglutathione lyase family enzyme
MIDSDEILFFNTRRNGMKIWKIALLVEDVKAAEKLYAEVLEMPVIERLDLGEAGEAVFLDAGNIRLELIPKAAFAGEERLGKTGVHHLSFKADDVEGTAEKLKEKGAEFIKEPFEALPGMTLAFFDGLNGVNLQLFKWDK